MHTPQKQQQEEGERDNENNSLRRGNDLSTPAIQAASSGAHQELRVATSDSVNLSPRSSSLLDSLAEERIFVEQMEQQISNPSLSPRAIEIIDDSNRPYNVPEPIPMQDLSSAASSISTSIPITPPTNDRLFNQSGYYGIFPQNSSQQQHHSIHQSHQGSQYLSSSLPAEKTYKASTASRWKAVATDPDSLPPTQRSLHVADVYKDSLYIFGGYDGSNRTNDFIKFDFHKRIWSTVNAKGNPPSPRDRHAGLIFDSYFLVFGGFNGTSKVNDFYAFDFGESKWMQLPNHQAPSPRHSHSAIIYNNAFYIFGGYDGQYKNDLHAFDFETQTWSLVTVHGRPPRPRYRTSLSIVDNKMICFGGHDGNKHLNDTHVFDFRTKTWAQIFPTGNTPIPRDSHTSISIDGSIYIFGGSTGSAMNDFHELQLLPKYSNDVATAQSPPMTNSFAFNQNEQAIDNSSFMNSSGEAATATQETSGIGSQHLPPNQQHQFDTLPNINSRTSLSRTAPSIGNPFPNAHWITIKAVGEAPSPRFCHTAAFYNNSMFIFGGYDGSSRLNDFMEFNFSTLTVDIPKSTLVDDLAARVNDPFLSDVTFLVEEKPVYAHKVLCIRCPYFRAMFTSEMRETTEKVIRLEGVGYDVFLLLLEFIYTDRIKNGIHMSIALDLFQASDLFGVERLRKLCENSIITALSVENAATIFAAADMHNAASLRQKCLTYILSHFDSVSKTEAFDQLGRENWALVSEILRKR